MIKTYSYIHGISNRISKLSSLLLLGLFILVYTQDLSAQDEEMQMPDRPVRALFESQLNIDQQTAVVPFQGTFEFDIQHRFGTLVNGYDDLFGLYANSNIRLGMTYVPRENLQVGLGLTKAKHIVDFNVKYAILKQMRSDNMPIAVTYYGNMGIDTRDEDHREDVYNSTDRYSYFHQILIARKFNHWLSLQIAPSLSHYNMIDRNMENDHFAVSFGGQLRITGGTFFIFGIDQPLTKHTLNNPNPNVSLGIELTTSSHAFQIFVGNYRSILPQENHVFNNNNWEDGIEESFLIGFNITRLWVF